jgi:hypothetical protein
VAFTTANWNVFRDVTITGVADTDVANENVTITATSAGLTTLTASVAVTDDDVLGIAASPTNLSLGEAGSGTFRVHLTAAPAGTVTVTVTNPDAGAVAVSTTSLTFTTANFATDQTVTVFGVADADVGNESVPLTLSSSGLANVTVTASVTDDDLQAFVVTPTALTISEGNTGSFTVALAFQPVSNVNVAISATNTAVAGVTVTNLTFTAANYNVPQTVGVNAVADADFNFNSAGINVLATGIITRSVTVTVREPGIIDAINNPTPSFCIFDATSIGVRLAGNPLGSLALSISTSVRVSAAPTDLQFDATNFSAYQFVDITGNSAGSGSLTIHGSGLTTRMTTFFVLAANAPACDF